MPELVNVQNLRLNPVSATPDTKGSATQQKKPQTAKDRVRNAAMKVAGAIVEYNKAKRIFLKAVKAEEKARAAVGKADTALFEAAKSANAAGRTAEAAAKKVNAARAAHEKAVMAAEARKNKALDAIFKNLSKRTKDSDQLPLPSKDDVYDLDGYAADEENYLYLNPDGEAVRTEDMLRKIKKRDWDA